MNLSNQIPAKRLILGTAQFGLPYGISNQRGQIPEAEVAAILAEAAKAGIDTLDTAAAYGSSETCSENNPPAGTYHISVRGYSAYSGVTVNASYE